MCCREDGAIWKPSAFTSAYRDLLRRRGIKISERLGHSRVAFTLDVYGHLLPGMQEEAAAKTEAGLRKAITARRSLSETKK